jgi:hypothetical protein
MGTESDIEISDEEYESDECCEELQTLLLGKKQGNAKDKNFMQKCTYADTKKIEKITCCSSQDCFGRPAPCLQDVDILTMFHLRKGIYLTGTGKKNSRAEVITLLL